MFHLSLLSAFTVTARLALAQTTTAAIFYPFQAPFDLEGYTHDTADNRTTYSLHCTDKSSDSKCVPTLFRVVAFKDNIELTSSNSFVYSGTRISYTDYITCSLYNSATQSSAVCTLGFIGDSTDVPAALDTTLLPPFVASHDVTITPAPPRTISFTIPSASGPAPAPSPAPTPAPASASASASDSASASASDSASASASDSASASASDSASASASDSASASASDSASDSGSGSATAPASTCSSPSTSASESLSASGSATATASVTGSGSTSAASAASTSTSTGSMSAVTVNARLVMSCAAMVVLAVLA